MIPLYFITKFTYYLFDFRIVYKTTICYNGVRLEVRTHTEQILRKGGTRYVEHQRS